MLVESAFSRTTPDPEALFAEARRHRRRRRRYVAVGVVAAVILTTAYVRVTGSSPTPTEFSHKSTLAFPRVVKFTGATVYFKASASRAEEHAVAKRLASNSRVARMQFVSKAAAFATLRRAEPQLTKGLAYNPLPDSFRVTLTNRRYANALRASLTPLPRGVSAVSLPR